MFLRMDTSTKKKSKSWIKTQRQEFLNCRTHATAGTSVVFKGVFGFSVTELGAASGSIAGANTISASPYHHSHTWYSTNKPTQTPASERNSWSRDHRVNSHSCEMFPPPTYMTATAFPHQPQKDGNKSRSGQMFVTYATRHWVTIKEREGRSLLKVLHISGKKHEVSIEHKRNKISSESEEWLYYFWIQQASQ